MDPYDEEQINRLLRQVSQDQQGYQHTQPIQVIVLLPPLGEAVEGSIQWQDEEHVPETDLPGDAQDDTDDDDVWQPEPIASQRRHRMPRRARRVLLLVACCLLGLLAGVAVQVLLPQLSATAEVTITPASQQVTSTQPVTITTSGSATGESQVVGRALSSLTMSQTRTVSTTGMAHQGAQAARGRVTFYNALPAVQTIPAGTLLTGTDGVQVVTEQIAVLPAGSGATNGQVTVAARALQAGPAGNIAAGDLAGTCCRAYVLATNTAFAGGQDARSYPVVSQQDVDGTQAGLRTSIEASAQAALNAQVHSAEETLLTPLACNPSVSEDHPVGSEATQVTVTVSKTCAGVAYSTARMQAVAQAQNQAEAATRHLGEVGYHLVGEVQVRVVPGSVQQEQGTGIHMQIESRGTWTVQVSEGQVRALAGRIAGKTKQEATRLLLREAGIQQVMLQVTGGHDTLPADPARIHILVVSRWGM